MYRLSLVWLFAAIPLFISNHSFSGTHFPDSYGYISDESATFAFVDIASSGTDLNAGDETTHGPISLGFTFRFYGFNYTEAFISSNGWLSFTDPGVPAGADPSNDCALPEMVGQDNFIAGIWDDLDASTPGGGIFHKRFAAGECPYEEYDGACFIVQWNQVVHFGTSDDMTFQIILFDNNEILLQILDASDERGDSSTTGTENRDGTIGFTQACSVDGSLSDNTAILFKREPAIKYVDDTAPPLGDGSSWSEAMNSLRFAIAGAAAGTQIWVAEGVYVPGGLETNTFVLVDGVEIYGGFEGLTGTEGIFDSRDPQKFITVLSGDIGGDDTKDQAGVVADAGDIVGQNTNHVVTGSGVNESALLDGFTITAGQADGTAPNDDGGGLLLENGDPTLANLSFIGNTAVNRGGGIYNGGGSPTLMDVTFSNNTVTGSNSRGAGMNSTVGSPRLSGVIFSGNSAEGSSGSGGGLYVLAGEALIENASFWGNFARSGGGGANIQATLSDFRNVAFVGNHTDGNGGGISFFGGRPLLVNSLFSGNTAERGGAMANRQSDPVLTNVTISGNQASAEGGALWNAGMVMMPETYSNPTLQNCILFGNEAIGEGDEIYNVFPQDIPTIVNTIIQGGCPDAQSVCENILDTNPVFVDADGPDNIFGTKDDDLRLHSGSPAIDLGNDNADLDIDGPGDVSISDLVTDLDGGPRLQGERVDLGAIEFQPFPSDTIYVNDDASGADTGLDWTNAYTDLQDALIRAPTGTQVFVAEGVYTPGTSETDTFRLISGVEWYGGFEGTPGTEGDFGGRSPEAFLTILSGDIDGDDTTSGKAVVTDPANIVGQNSDHIVSATGTDDAARMDGFTITAGQAEGVLLVDQIGGGMFIVNGHPELSNLVFIGNTAEAGGGVGISDDCHPTLDHILFVDNDSTQLGGAVATFGANPILMNCRFLGNNSVIGGAMYNFAPASPSIVNTLFFGNTATDLGGAIYNISNEPILTNCTLSENTAGNRGGGMFTQGMDTSPTVQNSILWGNTAGVSGDQIVNSDATTIFFNNLIQGSGGSGAGWDASLGTDGGGNLDMDPLFVDPDGVDNATGTLDDDLRLLAGSPAINSGSNNADLDGASPETTTISDIPLDLDGNLRIADGTVDMGSYEFGSMPPSPTPTATFTASNTPTPSNTPTATNTPTITDTPMITDTPTPTDTSPPTQTFTITPSPSSSPVNAHPLFEAALLWSIGYPDQVIPQDLLDLLGLLANN